jgi:hypothetical protein
MGRSARLISPKGISAMDVKIKQRALTEFLLLEKFYNEEIAHSL